MCARNRLGGDSSLEGVLAWSEYCHQAVVSLDSRETVLANPNCHCLAPALRSARDSRRRETIIQTRNLIAFALLLLGSTAILAQTDDHFAGKWRLLWNDGKRSATLTIGNSGGTWYASNMSKMNPCVTISAPLKILSLAADKIVVRAELSQVRAECSDVKVVIKREPDGTYSAMRGNKEASISKLE